MLHLHKTELCVLMTVSQITCSHQKIVRDEHSTRESIQGHIREQRKEKITTYVYSELFYG